MNWTTTWLFVGSSPSVTTWLPVALDRHENLTTITTNSGIKLIPRPDVYVLVDQFACRNYHDAAVMAQRLGTHLVTLKRSQAAIRERKLEHFDEFLYLPAVGDVVRGGFARFVYSGPLCLQYALVQGATKVVCVGMDGYKRGNDYFDAEDRVQAGFAQGLDKPPTVMRNALVPAYEAIADAYSDVEFIVYGEPAYNVSRRNWRVAS